MKQIRVSGHNAELISRSWENPKTPKAAVIGFGKVGRGVVIPTLTDSGMNVYAIERNGPLVDSYKKQGCYRVIQTKHLSQKHKLVEGAWLMDNKGELTTFVDKASDHAVSIIVTATAPTSISSNVSSDPTDTINLVHSILKAKFDKETAGERSTVNLICTEDTPHATEIMRNVIMGLANTNSEFSDWIAGNVGFVDNVLDVITPILTDSERSAIWDQTKRRDDLVTLVEGSTSWYWDSTDMVSCPVGLNEITLVDNIAPYQIRQTNMFDSAQISIAVLGALMDHRMMNAAAQNEEIHSFTISMVETEVIHTLEGISGFDRPSLQHFMNSAMHRMSDPSLKDELSRVVSNPLRKLQRNERLIAPALSAVNEFSITPRKLCFTIAALLYYSANHNIARDRERAIDPKSDYWDAMFEKQELLKAAIADIRNSSIKEASEKLNSILTDVNICRLDTTLYHERLVAKKVTKYFIDIAKALDSSSFENLLMEQLKKEREPVILRPTGIILKD